MNYSATNNPASCFNFHCLINTNLYFQVLYDIWDRQSYLETSKGKLSTTATSKSSLSILVNSSISEKFSLNAGELYSLYRTVKAWSLLLFHSVMELRMCHLQQKNSWSWHWNKSCPTAVIRCFCLRWQMNPFYLNIVRFEHNMSWVYSFGEHCCIIIIIIVPYKEEKSCPYNIVKYKNCSEVAPIFTLGLIWCHTMEHLKSKNVATRKDFSYEKAFSWSTSQ